MAYKRRNREFEERIAGLVRRNGNRTALPPTDRVAVHHTLSGWAWVALAFAFIAGFIYRGLL